MLDSAAAEQVGSHATLLVGFILQPGLSMQITKLLSVLFTLPLSATAFSQSTWVVDATGSAGSHFRTLSAAVSRAAAGDRIRVRQGVYKATTISKPISVFAEPAAFLEIGPRDPALVIERIPPGTVCSIQGFSLKVETLGSFISLKSSAGRIVLSDLEIPKVEVFRGRVEIEQCGSVTLERCEFWTGLFIRASRVLAVQSEFELGSFNTVISAWKSHLTMVQCKVNATGEARSINTPIYVVDCDHSTLELRGDASSVYRGGIELRRQTPWLVQHHALVGRGTSYLIRDPRVDVVRPQYGGFLTDVIQRRPFLTARGGRLTQTIDLAVDSRPNQPFVLYVGLPGVHTPIPGLGDAWIDLNAFFPIDRRIQAATGATSMRRAVPNLPSLVGLVLTYQAVAGTTPSLSNGATLTLTDR